MGLRKFGKSFVVATLFMFFAVSAFGQIREIRPASGAILSAADTTDAQFPREQANEAIVFIDINVITTADGDDEVDLYIQTTYDGVNWVDRANIHFAVGDNGTTAKRVVVFGAPVTGDNIVTPTDGTLADNTDAAVPLGVSVRIKVLITGATAPSYDYTATVFYTRR